MPIMHGIGADRPAPAMGRHREASSWHVGRIAAALVLAASATAWSDDEAPYGEWAPQPAGTAAGMTYGAGDIPTVGDVGIAAYPDALVASLGAPGLMGDSLPFVNLVSANAMEDVLAFYREEVGTRDGWSWSGLAEVFYEGSNQMSAIAMMARSVNVTELDPAAIDIVGIRSDIKQDLRTRIQIVYKP